jgi:hypothetical protein
MTARAFAKMNFGQRPAEGFNRIGVVRRVPQIGCIAKSDLLRQWHIGFPS